MTSEAPVISNLVDPFELSDDDGYVWLKGSLHTHTTNSDGQEAPQDRLDQYVAKGYDFLCLSDHHKITPVDSVNAPGDFVLIEGAELHPQNPFGGSQHRFVCLDIHDDMDAENMHPQDVIDVVNGQGGKVWLAHPYWSGVNIMRDTLPLKGFAGVEVFNTTCRCMGRGDSGPIWDDWMHQTNRLIPMLANDDAHAKEADNHDTYQGWTMVRARERSVEALMDAMNTGASYGSTGPEIYDISLNYAENAEAGVTYYEVTIKCSEAVRVVAIQDWLGSEYWEHGKTFTECSWHLAIYARWVRFEVIAPDGTKAWTNPIDLTPLKPNA